MGFATFLRVGSTSSDVLKLFLLAGRLKTLTRILFGRGTIYKGGSGYSNVLEMPLLAEVLKMQMSMIHESGFFLW